jgi:1,4-dihydroxy-2-naphthoate octaprenyltransferase
MRFSKNLQSLARHFFYGNVWIAMMSVAAMWQASMLLKLKASPDLFLLMFFATLSHYNIDRLLEHKHYSNSIQVRHKWLSDRKTPLLFFSLLPGLLAALLLIRLPIACILWVGVLAFFAMMYSLPVTWKGLKLSFRQWGISKPLLIGLVWSGMSAGLLLVYHQQSMLPHLSYLLGYWFFISALCLPFDWRDRVQDHAAEINTLALRLQPKRLLVLQALLLGFSGLLIQYWFPKPFWSLWLVLLGTLLISHQAMHHDGEYWYLFGIDGLIGLLAFASYLELQTLN